MAGFRSRLARKEEARNLRRALLYGLLTILVVILVLFWGIPSLVRIATFFNQWQSSSTPVGKSDLLPPAPPKINPIPAATKKDLLSISGQAEAGSTVEIFLQNAAIQTVVADNEGRFTIDRLKLSSGENKIHAVATDQAGNISQPSTKMTILFDNQAPELEIFSPQDRATFSGEKQKKVTISGKTEPGITLTINDRLIILNQEGNFSTTRQLSEGENIFKIVASDRADNQTEKEIKVTYTP